MAELDFTDVKWDEVEAQEDFNEEIAALQGNYVGEVKDFKFIEMADSEGFYSLNVQINETVKGIKGDNRYISRTFNVGETQYQSAEESKEKLVKVLKTIGADSPMNAVGRPISMKIRPNMDKETKKVKRDGKGWPKHIVTIVTGFEGTSPVADSPISF